MEVVLSSLHRYRLAWFEIFLLVCLYFLFVWIAPGIYFTDTFPKITLLLLLLLAATYFAYLSPKIHSNSLAERGMGQGRRLFIKCDSLKTDSRAYGLFALICLAFLGCAIALKSSQGPLVIDYYAFGLKYALYIMSASFQDTVFFSFLLLRIKFLISCHLSAEQDRNRQILTSFLLAAVFGLAHAPNWPLLKFTFVFAFGLAWIFYRRPNLFLAVMCHAFFGAVLHRIVQLHMKFGLFYGQTEADASFIRKVIPGLEVLIGNRW